MIDSNILLDIFTDDPEWADRSESILEHYNSSHALYINPMIYSEVSIGFERIEEFDAVLTACEVDMIQIPKEALFLAGKVFLKYRKRKGKKRSPLPDFYIGAHAAVLGIPLITRDVSRYSTYFPTLRVVSP